MPITNRTTPSLRRDARGVPVTTASADAVDLLDDAVLGFVGHRGDTAQRIERALGADPGLVPALCLQGFAYKALGRTDLEVDAQARLQAARESLALRGGSERERGLTAALDAWCQGQPILASQALARVLREHPCDLLAFKMSHALDFVLGRAAAMRATCEAVLAAWDERCSGIGYVLGCHAFALEETGELDRAERVGKRALALEPLDAWGAHAVAHVMETQDRPDDGIAWMDAVEPQLAGCNNFDGHLAWHRTLFHLQRGELEQALLLHDQRIAIHLGRDYRDLANSATLLWRLEREGLSVGQRWQRLAELARARIGDHGLAFADIHYVLALAGAGDMRSAERFVASMRDAACHRTGVYAHVARDVGVPFAQGIVALAQGCPDTALARMLPVSRSNARLGGSRAQRDAFALLLIEAALHSSHPELARCLLDQRLRERPGNALARERLQRFFPERRSRSSRPPQTGASAAA
jgi:tetratricopeptide (TPR) repeat protein